MRDHDSLHRFVFEHFNVRGEIVHLDATWRAVLERHDYPPPVRDLLGQAMAAAALLTATLKFKGALTLQVQGEGPVKLLVVQSTSERTLRGLARWDGPVEAAPLQTMFGAGRMALTIEPEGGFERYQGIVELGGGTLADALTGYFRQSEQLETRLWLAADEGQAAGLLLQALPGESDDEDAWNRTVHLADTITAPELLRLSAREVLYRLFHEEDVRLFEPVPVSFRCGCSRQRIEAVLRQFGYGELQDILREEGSVSVDCEFCNHHYEFDAVDVEQLFAADVPPQGSSRTH